MLLIFDEVQTGFGRMGTMFAADYYDVLPDIIVFGKGVGGGFPLAGILADDKLKWFDEGEEALTFGHFPVSLAAGYARQAGSLVVRSLTSSMDAISPGQRTSPISGWRVCMSLRRAVM